VYKWLPENLMLPGDPMGEGKGEGEGKILAGPYADFTKKLFPVC